MFRSDRRPSRVPTWLEAHAERLAFSEWLDAQRTEKGLTAGALAAALGEGYVADGGSSSVNRYLKRGHIPRPEIMRKLADALGIPWLEVVPRAGYYREIISMLDDLAWLGERWLEEDDARGGTLRSDGSPAPRLQSLHDLGVTKWKGERVTRDVTEDASFRKRYTVGSWFEEEAEVERVEYPMVEQQGSNSKVLVADMSKPPTKREIVVEPARSVHCILPKPIALAILLTGLMFCRRGDLYRDEVTKPGSERTDTYLWQLYTTARALIEDAHRLRERSKSVGRPRKLHPLLQRVRDALDDQLIPFDNRRVVAAEYAVAWADSLCSRYTHIVRLATFHEWGEAGSSLSTRTPWRSMPNIRLAKLPPIEEFSVNDGSMNGIP